jgi:hypothetical protein
LISGIKIRFIRKSYFLKEKSLPAPPWAKV